LLENQKCAVLNSALSGVLRITAEHKIHNCELSFIQMSHNIVLRTKTFHRLYLYSFIYSFIFVYYAYTELQNASAQILHNYAKYL